MRKRMRSISGCTPISAEIDYQARLSTPFSSAFTPEREFMFILNASFRRTLIG
jgi:hypothetical protein